MSLFPFAVVESIGQLYQVDQLFDFLSSGTFATVFRGVRLESASNMDAGQVVALKVISKKDITNEKQRDDVINEVAILRRLQHENCVRLLDVFQTQHEVCLVLEFIPGKELFSAVSTSRLLPELKVKSILRQVFSALKYLHNEKRIVHRDLKPENILITDITPMDVHVTLVDFGLAKLYGHRRPRQRQFLGHHQSTAPRLSMMHSSPFLTRSTSLESVESTGSHANSPMLTTPCGTLKYAAPETVRSLVNGVPVQTTRASLPKLDTFAVGLIAFVLLGGQLPYNTKNKAALAVEMEQGPKFTGTRWGSVSEQAKDLVSQLLSPDASQRLSAEQALEHPWLAPLACTPQQLLDDEIPPAEKPPTPPPSSGQNPNEMERSEMRSAFSAMIEEQLEPTLKAPPPLMLPSQWASTQQVATYFPFCNSN